MITEGASREDMLKRMSSTIQSHAGSKFRHLVMSLRMHMQNDDWLAERPLDFGELLAAGSAAPDGGARGPGRRTRSLP